MTWCVLVTAFIVIAFGDGTSIWFVIHSSVVVSVVQYYFPTIVLVQYYFPTTVLVMYMLRTS